MNQQTDMYTLQSFHTPNKVYLLIIVSEKPTYYENSLTNEPEKIGLGQILHFITLYTKYSRHLALSIWETEQTTKKTT